MEEKKVCTKCDLEYYDGKQIGFFLMKNTRKMKFCMVCGAPLKETNHDD